MSIIKILDTWEYINRYNKRSIEVNKIAFVGEEYYIQKYPSEEIELVIEGDGLHLVDLDWFFENFTCFLNNRDFVMSDSDGIQETQIAFQSKNLLKIKFITSIADPYPKWLIVESKNLAQQLSCTKVITRQVNPITKISFSLNGQNIDTLHFKCDGYYGLVVDSKDPNYDFPWYKVNVNVEYEDNNLPSLDYLKIVDVQGFGGETYFVNTNTLDLYINGATLGSYVTIGGEFSGREATLTTSEKRAYLFALDLQPAHLPVYNLKINVKSEHHNNSSSYEYVDTSVGFYYATYLTVQELREYLSDYTITYTYEYKNEEGWTDSNSGSTSLNLADIEINPQQEEYTYFCIFGQ